MVQGHNWNLDPISKGSLEISWDLMFPVSLTASVNAECTADATKSISSVPRNAYMTLLNTVVIWHVDLLTMKEYIKDSCRKKFWYIQSTFHSSLSVNRIMLIFYIKKVDLISCL